MREFIVSLVTLALIEVFAGLSLKFNVELLVAYSVVLILIPGLMDLRGDVYGAIGYRFTKGLHLGLTQPKLLNRFNLINASTGYVNSIVVTFLLCLIGVGLSLVSKLSMPDFLSLIFIASFSTVSVFVVLTPVILAVIAYMFKLGHDPSPFVATVVTGIGDVMTPVVLIGVAYMHELFPYFLKALFVLASLGLTVALTAYMVRVGELKNLIENLVSSTLASTGSSLGGFYLALSVGFIAENPEILGVIPAFNAVIGAAMGYLSNSLNVDLHIGTDRYRNTYYRNSVAGLMATHASVLTALAAVTIFSKSALSRALTIALGVALSCLILYLVSTLITYLLTVVSFHHGWDPDNLVFPVMTTFVDLMGPVILTVIAIHLLP
ncbi:MAG: magnesium transporter [Sulfolobales archaeon]